MLLFSVVFAALVAVAASVAVERVGGTWGGLLATLPTTIVPAAWTVWAAAANADDFRHSLSVVPLGMLCNTAFLSVWAWLPPLLSSRGNGRRFAAVLAVALGIWIGCAVLAIWLGHSAFAEGWGALGFLGQVLIAVAMARRGNILGGKRSHSTAAALVLRAVFAAAVVAAVGFLAKRGEGTIAGIAAVFPVIFMTTMGGLWWSHGEDLPRRAVGPMMLGAWSIGGYAYLAAWIFPVLGPGWGTVVAWSAVAVAQGIVGWKASFAR